MTSYRKSESKTGLDKMARTRKTLPEAFRIVIDDLTFVLNQVKGGRAGDNEINELVRCIWRIRQGNPPQTTEEELVRTFREADEAYRRASEAVGAFFWPLAKECKTEEEARALISRCPSPVDRANLAHYFMREVKLIPIPERN